jgi:hypothetical protein
VQLPMAPIPDGGIVAVTGASGYIGSHIVTQLLDGGYRVRACVRDDTSPKCSFLRAMPQCVTGRLTLHSCDITVPGVFDDVLEGAHGVVHSADQLMSAGGEEKGHTAAAHPQAAVAAVLPRPAPPTHHRHLPLLLAPLLLRAARPTHTTTRVTALTLAGRAMALPRAGHRAGRQRAQVGHGDAAGLHLLHRSGAPR